MIKNVTGDLPAAEADALVNTVNTVGVMGKGIALQFKRGIRSIAVPPLGAGNGGLDWKEVEPLIGRAFAALPEAAVLLYPPGPPLRAAEMRDLASAPRMPRGLPAHRVQVHG